MYDQEVAGLLRTLNEGFPPVETMSAADARAAVAARAAPVTNLSDVRATRDESAGGVPVRVYEPHDPDPAATIVFAHGGGFVLCDLDSHDGFCRALARGTGSTVVSVDYRRAPEHRAPAAAEDVYTALVWAAESFAGPLLVAGDSAGGNLAAAAALMARDHGGPALAGQVLLYPVIDPGCDSPSYASRGTGHYLTSAAMRWYWDHYLGGAEPSPYVAPLRAESLAGLPPAVVVVGRLDPLHSEGVAYATALGAAGVPVVLREYPDMFHGFVTIGPFTPAASARSLLWSDVRALVRS